MLVLARKKNEEIVLGSGNSTVMVKVLEIAPDRVKIGVVAPGTVSILRRELLLRPEPKKKGRPPKAGR